MECVVGGEDQVTELVEDRRAVAYCADPLDQQQPCCLTGTISAKIMDPLGGQG